MKRLIMLGILVLSLAACGGDATEAPLPTEAATVDVEGASSEDNADEMFDVNITGAEDLTISGDGVFSCRDSAQIQAGTEGEQIETPAIQTISVVDANTQGVTLFMPPQAAAGTYDLETQTAENVGEVYSISVYTGPEEYNTVTEGTVTYEALPTGPDEPVVGNFSATLTTDEDATIEVSGEFNFSSLDTDDGIILADFYCE